MNTYFPQVKINVVFISNYKISNFFRFKDKMPDSIRSSLVYMYTCSRCTATYVGKTVRHFSTRISEHRGVSHRTNQPIMSSHSSIRSHINNNNHHNYSITPEQFKILVTSTSDFELLLKESILIKQLKPSLNDMEAINLKIL